MLSAVCTGNAQMGAGETCLGLSASNHVQTGQAYFPNHSVITALKGTQI